MPSAHANSRTVKTRPRKQAQVLGYDWLRRRRTFREAMRFPICTQKSPRAIQRISKSHTATLFWISTTPSGERSLVNTHSLQIMPVQISVQPIKAICFSKEERDFLGTG